MKYPKQCNLVVLNINDPQKSIKNIQEHDTIIRQDENFIFISIFILEA